MKKKLQGLIIGTLIGATLTGSGVFARNLQETINAIYMNVKLVVDGEEITPKDVNGNEVEPFIYNGTTYLPVRAIGEAFDKDVHWDSETATIYVGEFTKPAKEVYLYDKPYLECDIPAEYKAGKSNDSGKGKIERNTVSNYVGFLLDKNEKYNDEYRYVNSVTYSLNGLCKSVKGTFIAPGLLSRYAIYTVSFYNESGKLLYKSPIMSENVSAVDFEFETGKALKLKVVFEAIGHYLAEPLCLIKDFRVLTTDY